MTAARLLAAVAIAGCSAATSRSATPTREQPASQTGVSGGTPAWLLKAGGNRPPFGKADIAFMQGMIHHHAQAVLMAGWAPSHGASPSMRELCERIVVSQRDEIAFMQRWLRERNLEVPDADGAHDMMIMPGMESMRMPGMLNAQQLAQLDSARGETYDRLFLQYMIMHHQGALKMVDDLFGSEGAAQDDAIFKFATDVNADQTAEIDRMSRMLAAMKQ